MNTNRADTLVLTFTNTIRRLSVKQVARYCLNTECIHAAAIALIWLTLVAPNVASIAVAGTIEQDTSAGTSEAKGQTVAGPFAGVEASLLALYKTMTYTITVLSTDQIWYMGIASSAEDTGGVFGMVNMVTSPLLTYAFEYTWERCCEVEPATDGVRPVDTNKAIFYRIISMTRTFGLALLFGNELGSSVLITAAISATRTVAYLTNDLIWNHLSAPGSSVPLVVAEH